jgi:hypothetical protein
MYELRPLIQQLLVLDTSLCFPGGLPNIWLASHFFNLFASSLLSLVGHLRIFRSSVPIRDEFWWIVKLRRLTLCSYDTCLLGLPF